MPAAAMRTVVKLLWVACFLVCSCERQGPDADGPDANVVDVAVTAQARGASPGGALAGTFRATHASTGAATFPLLMLEVWAVQVAQLL
jgi:hypothetical protein